MRLYVRLPLNPRTVAYRKTAHPLPQLFVATLACGVVVGAVVLTSVRLALRALGGGAAQVLPVQGSLITGLTTLFALMVAFSAAGIWSDDVQARVVVQREANALENIVALASYLPDASREEVRTEILRIAHLVVDKDWPAMKRRVGLNEPLFDRSEISPVAILIASLSKVATGPASNMLLGQIVELRSARLHREMIARSGVSAAVWVALLIPPILALTVIALAYNHRFGWQLAATSIYIVGVCVALVVILAHDRPFVGHFGLKPIPIEVAINRIQRMTGNLAPPPQTLPTVAPNHAE
jgi:hypothetical protein